MIRHEEPLAVDDDSELYEINLYERWERSNHLSIMFTKTKFSATIHGSVDHHTRVKELLKTIDEQFETSKKALATTLIIKFSTLMLTGIKEVHDHIMQMRDIAAQLKILEIEMFEKFLVHYILNTLPSAYVPFKISYNTHKNKWSINELLNTCVQEEGRLIMEMGESTHMAIQGKNKNQYNQDKQKGKKKLAPKADIKKDFTCFFCKKKGHMKKDCIKYKKWLEKKDNLTSFVCYESNITDVNHNTWWIDPGSIIHVLNTL